MKYTRKKGNLYNMAREAKNRLKNYKKESIFNTSYKIQSFSQEDGTLYKKVCKILESDEIITNPIMELVDKDYYYSLSEESKQKYIFNLSDKYKQMKERYFKDKSAQMSKVSNL
ncbi:MAG: hypothetical protein PHP83_03250 [Clostridia bacterium]|nr:hypothetical protein [Clostridia bacterium]